MFCTGTKGDRSQKKNSKEIDRLIRSESRDTHSKSRILLLGAGESGKSTFFKQMRIIYQDGFDEEERLKYKQVILANILQAIHTLIKAAGMFKIPFQHETNESIAMEISRLSSAEDMQPEVLAYVSRLWGDNAIQRAYSMRHTYQLLDSTAYWMSALPRISEGSWVPSQQDVLHSRVRTTAISEIMFQHGGHHFNMIDVGGQRGERRKWIHLFQNVTAVLFFASLSAFDQSLAEDPQQNRMQESLLLFEETSNSPWFKDTPFILFLNKVDLFREKIKTHSITSCPALANYEGPATVEATTSFIGERFVATRRSTKQVYVYPTCATDTKHISKVFAAVKDIILRINLSTLGLIDS